jgi:chemotaxis response regulator CheB
MIRVLVVHDSPLARKVVTDALQGNPGISLAGTAPNAEIALGKLKSLRPDVVIMDLEMPGMGRDGARGFARLRARGGLVLAQDEATSAIYGMNRAVVDNGDAGEVLPLGAIAARLGELCELREQASKEQEQ